MNNIDNIDNDILSIKSSISTSKINISKINEKINLLNAKSELLNDNIKKNLLKDPIKLQKIKILSLLQQLETIPLSNPSSETIPSSIATTKIRNQSFQLSKSSSLKTIVENLEFQKSLNNFLSISIDYLSNQLNDLKLNNNDYSQSQFQSQSDELMIKINNLKLKTKNLSSYIKIIVNDYLFAKEFNYLFIKLDNESIKSRKQKFLKLLETLLNNNILHPNSSKKSYITLSSIDDPLIRFLILNRIIVVHPTIQNKVMLRDLSFNL
jgi:hypothetical protein